MGQLLAWGGFGKCVIRGVLYLDEKLASLAVDAVRTLAGVVDKGLFHRTVRLPHRQLRIISQLVNRRQEAVYPRPSG